MGKLAKIFNTRLSVYLLLFAFVLAAYQLTWINFTKGGWDYNAAVLGMNYFDFGFVRRGLSGSIAYLFGSDLLRATIWFYLVALGIVVVLALQLLNKRIAAPLTLIPYVILFGGILLFWACDPGRTDVLIAAFLMLAASAMTNRKPAVACVWLAIGLMTHETAIIYGLPLVVALALRDCQYRSMPLAKYVTASLILLIAVAVYIFTDRFPHASVNTIVSTVRNELPRNELVDRALYLNLSGIRVVRTAMCRNALDPRYALHLIEACILIALAIFAISRWPWSIGFWLAILVSIPPFIFLWIVALDHARWVTLSMLNIWLLGVTDREPRKIEQPLIFLAEIACAALVLVLHYPRIVGQRTVVTPSPMMERVANKFGITSAPSFPETLLSCDPNWREALEKMTSRRD